MNKLALLVSLLCVALAAAGTAPKGWPSTFAVTYNETVLFGYNPGSVMKTFYYDGVNQRGHLSSGVTAAPSDFFLIYKAQDAPANYISLQKNPEGTTAPNNCFFYTQPFNNVTAPSSYSFGDLWNDAENNNGVLSFLFKYPQLVYSGDVYIAELGVWSAQWNSVEYCNLIQSGIGLVPCASVFISKDGRGTTLKEIHVNAVNPNSYYRDTYLTRIYHSNTETLPSGAFDLPNDWVDSCGYADSGFIFNTAIDVFKDRTGLLALSLAVPPVGKSTRVKVSFAVSPEENFECTDCVKLRSPSLYFDATNWNVPQALYVDYNNYGCEKLDIVASGGGYDWQMYPQSNSIRLLSCVANNDYKTCYSLQKKCMMIM